MTEAAAPRAGFNLLGLAPFRALIRWRWFPMAFQCITLAAFLGLMVLGWQVFAPAGVSSKLYAKANLVNLLIWGLWWPVMVWVAVLCGRLWCAVCPLELVASYGEKASALLGLRQRKLGRWLRAGWVILLSYAAIQLLVAGVGLHRTPAYTSLFLAFLILSAALVGFLFRHRAYCRGFCPVGLLLGTYGRGSMLAVRANHEPLGEPIANPGLVARSCPSMLNPPKLDSNKDCLICGACVKASPHDEMAIVLRRPFHADDAREPTASWPITLFVLLVSGFVTYELTTNWPAGKKLFLWLPAQVSTGLGLQAGNGWIAGVWKLLVWPLLLWSLLGGLTVLTKGAANIGVAWRQLALPAVIVVAAGHLAKGLEKLATWGGYLPQAIAEPRALESSRAYAAGDLAKPASLLTMPVLSAVAVALIVGACWFACRELRLSDPNGYRRRRPAVLALAVLFGFLGLRWGLWA